MIDIAFAQRFKSWPDNILIIPYIFTIPPPETLGWRPRERISALVPNAWMLLCPGPGASIIPEMG